MVKGTIVKSVARLLVGVVLPLSGVVALTATAEARSIGAYAGNPLDNAPRSCFGETNGAVFGGTSVSPCTGRWAVSLPVDTTATTYTVTFSAAWGGLGVKPDCFAVGVSQLGVVQTPSPAVSATTTSFVAYPLGAVSVPTKGYLYLVCEGVVTGSVIGSVYWQ
jgi:hypothetical protein